jgi:hypothetical protein
MLFFTKKTQFRRNYLWQEDTKMSDVDPNAATGPSVGLTVVHCRESAKQMSWLEEVPKNWKVVVYETCGQNISEAASRPFRNAGSEECTAYLQTMIDSYDNLPDINIFMQSDTLIGTKSGKVWNLEHSPFRTIAELINATFSAQNESLAFLHYGPSALRQTIINSGLDYHGYSIRDIFDIFRLPYSNTTKVKGRAAASFAVSKDRILANPVERYIDLQHSFYPLNWDQARRRCCGAENSWHAMLGEPYVILPNATVDHLWAKKNELLPGKKQV